MHRVFVSYAKEDQDAAYRVCEMLEAEGTRCWLASRDAIAEQDKAGEVSEAICSSDLVLLVFSASANASPGVLREMERAAAYQRPVLSVRVDGATPNVSLQHYLDLAPEPDAVFFSENATEPELAPPAEAVRRRKWYRRTLLIALGLAVLAAALGLGFGLGLDRHQSTWTELEPSGTLPEPRAAHVMASDPTSGRLIMFGGAVSTDQDDTWAYDPVADAWTELEPAGMVPAPRTFASMSYDLITRRLILFGGDDDKGAFLNDTWAYDPVSNTWIELKPAGAPPPARAWHTMVCDSDTGKLIMFGGGAGGFTSDITAVDQLGDTWSYDPTRNIWTELEPAGAVPAARYSQAMAYDPSTQKVILFGGATGTTRFNDMWAYDPAANAWTELDPEGTLPSPRGGHSMAYDPTSRRLIMFGGGVSQTVLVNDTWAYDPNTNAWTELKPEGMLPCPRGAHRMACDPTSQRLIVFGGLDEAGGYLNDTWAFSP